MIIWEKAFFYFEKSEIWYNTAVYHNLKGNDSEVLFSRKKKEWKQK